MFEVVVLWFFALKQTILGKAFNLAETEERNNKNFKLFSAAND
jgi:hypothetical protein